MDMTKSNLYREFSKLSLNSIKSVQNGQSLNDLDLYLHVERPVESVLRQKMRDIDQCGGGIVLLIGSAGDGKSHLLSRLRSEFDWDSSSYYNDATASCSPNKTAVQTLKEALVDFCDASIDTTNRKLVLAVNLGKLNAFIEDADVKNSYSKIVEATAGIFDDDDATEEKETSRIKIVLIAREQMFEISPECQDQFTMQAPFLSKILEKIVYGDDANPFHRAYLADREDSECEQDPVYLNYKILQSPQVRDTLVRGIIESIVRFKLIITPREFLDFIYCIMVPRGLEEYDAQRDYYKTLLPSLLFCGGTNLIQRAFAKLDPIIYSSTDHDKKLAELFTSYAIPEDIESAMRDARIPECIIDRINKFYQNNGRQLDVTTKFVFRLFHILSYHSESGVYTNFMRLLTKIFNRDPDAYAEIYEVVGRALPRHFGSFYEKNNMIPLGVQGGEYKLFANLELDPQPIDSSFNPDHPSRFPLWVTMKWRVGGEVICLKVDYQLYSYLDDLNQGRLVTAYENERNLAFSTFVRQLASKANMSEVTIVKSCGTEKKLQESFGKVRLA